MRRKKSTYEAIVIGTSAGGLEALARVLPELRPDLPVPVLIVQHISASSDSFLIEYFNGLSSLPVKEAEDKEPLKAGTIYFAPPDYHLQVEENRSLSLSNSEKINYSRPSIDVLFETAVWAFGSSLIGVIMTGANWDGAEGLQKIFQAGGYTIVQDPKSAAVSRMPEAAIQLRQPSAILELEKIGQALNDLV